MFPLAPAFAWLCLLAILLRSTDAGEAGRLAFEASGERLLRCAAGDLLVTFTTSGAFVVARDGKFLADGGLAFHEKGWKRWGSQVRRSSEGDSFTLRDGATQASFRCVLKDLDRRDCFEVQQAVEAIGEGLTFSYSAKALQSFPAEVFGLEFHFPLAQVSMGAWSFALDSQKFTPSPDFRNPTMAVAPAKCFSLLEKDRPVMEARFTQPLQCALLDDRAHQLHVARALISAPLPNASFQEGQIIEASMTLWLNSRKQALVKTLGSLEFQFEESGRFTLKEGKRAWRGGLYLAAEESQQPALPSEIPPAEAAMQAGNSPAGDLLLAGRALPLETGSRLDYRLRVAVSESRLDLVYRFRAEDYLRGRDLGLMLLPEDLQGVVKPVSPTESSPSVTEWLLEGLERGPVRLVCSSPMTLKSLGDVESGPRPFFLSFRTENPVPQESVILRRLSFQLAGADSSTATLPAPSADGKSTP
ncbi:MAG: hypothetical protein HYU36_00085 [Planctomycetes bacterium]|nr:hypothetical protein [Planctomycetota bacterium]